MNKIITICKYHLLNSPKNYHKKFYSKTFYFKKISYKTENTMKI